MLVFPPPALCRLSIVSLTDYSRLISAPVLSRRPSKANLHISSAVWSTRSFGFALNDINDWQLQRYKSISQESLLCQDSRSYVKSIAGNGIRISGLTIFGVAWHLISLLLCVANWPSTSWINEPTTRRKLKTIVRFWKPDNHFSIS